MSNEELQIKILEILKPVFKQIPEISLSSRRQMAIVREIMAAHNDTIELEKTVARIEELRRIPWKSVKRYSIEKPYLTKEYWTKRLRTLEREK